MANLRLDVKDGMFADRSGHPVIVTGNAAASLLYQRISVKDKTKRICRRCVLRAQSDRTTADRMSSSASGSIRAPSGKRIGHTFRPKRPEVPPVQNARFASWPRNPIDNFVLARLAREGLQPSREADRATLLRRVSFDLTGLPPTTAEVDAFVADNSPGAYEKVVDHLLQSPHYGERMAMQWLDLARYADTHGYHIDSHREMWHWRDWVIDAFNHNMPFDQFTVEQLAGDLLPNPTLSQKIATGFNRNHMINFEGGAIPEEYQTEYVVDRVEATSTTWMGMTLGCARCHDHKYDPIKQRDFYRFFAFFNTIPEKGLDGRKGNAKPFVQIPSTEQAEKIAEVTATLDSTEKTLDDTQVDPVQTEWEKTKLDVMPAPSHEGLVAHYALDGSFADSSGHYHDGRALNGIPVFADGPVGNCAELGGEAHVSFGNVADFDRSDPLSLAFWVESNSVKQHVVFEKISDAGERRGYEVAFDDTVVLPRLKRGAYLRFRLTHHWPDDAIEVRAKETLVENDFYHLAITYDGSGKAAGIRLFVDGKPAEIETVHDSLMGAIRTEAPFEIGNRKLGNAFKGRLDDIRIYSRVLAPAEIGQLALDEPARVSLTMSAGQRSKDQKEKLRAYFLTHEAPEPLRVAFSSRRQAEALKDDLDWTVPSAMVMDEMEKPIPSSWRAAITVIKPKKSLPLFLARCRRFRAICPPIAWASPSGWSAQPTPSRRG